MKLNIEAAAKELAERMDYPWDYMPTEDKPKSKDYGHAGPKCGADDCWLRNE